VLDYIDTSKYSLLPNTAGCIQPMKRCAPPALGAEGGVSNWVSSRSSATKDNLFPDNEQLVRQRGSSCAKASSWLPYTTDDPVVCRKLEDAGAAAIMPLGAPIGSASDQEVNNLRIIREFARVPLIVDAGVGRPSDAALAMELGATRS